MAAPRRAIDEILWASNPPLVPIDPHFRELEGLALKDGVLDPYLHANAARPFFGENPA